MLSQLFAQLGLPSLFIGLETEHSVLFSPVTPLNESPPHDSTAGKSNAAGDARKAAEHALRSAHVPSELGKMSGGGSGGITARNSGTVPVRKRRRATGREETTSCMPLDSITLTTPPSLPERLRPTPATLVSA